jgi:hypothetical protein
VLVQGGQCSPVIENVAFVGSAEYIELAEISPRPIVASSIVNNIRMCVLQLISRENLRPARCRAQEQITVHKACY